MKLKLFFAGSGGQGTLAIGQMIAKAAMDEGKEVTWLPSYGPEMRGGTANCTVVVSDKPISCPLINDADVLVAMNLPSLRKFIIPFCRKKMKHRNSLLLYKKEEQAFLPLFFK